MSRPSLVGSGIGLTLFVGRVSAWFIWVESWPSFCFGLVPTRFQWVKSRSSFCFGPSVDPLPHGSGLTSSKHNNTLDFIRQSNNTVYFWYGIVGVLITPLYATSLCT
jgi:hypothetical protein